MTPEQLDLIREDIRQTIQEKVNGKIDQLTSKLEEHVVEHKEDTQNINKHMKEVRPILDEYQERKTRDKLLLAAGEKIKWTSGVLLAAGALWVIIRGIFKV